MPPFFRPVISRLLIGCILSGGLLTACAETEPKPTALDEDDIVDDSDDTDDDEGPSTGDMADASVASDGSVKDASVKRNDGGARPSDAGVTGPRPDAAVDGGALDAGKVDGGVSDAGNTDAAAVDAGDADASEPDAQMAPPSDDLCELEGHEVGIIGDSYIQLSGDFTRLLQEKARAVGALDANETYIDHAVSGASMNGTPNIPAQLPEAVRESKSRGGDGLKLLIMTGGGNDVLVNNRPCLDATSVADVDNRPACVKTVTDTLTTAQKLFDDAVAGGVKATIFFFYPHLPENSLLGGPNANNILDYSVPKAKELCDKQTAAPCYFVDLRPAFDDPNNEGWPRPGLIAFDGIHPTLEGSKVMAEEIWKVMQDKCLAVK